jgi:hypothetical protein
VLPAEISTAHTENTVNDYNAAFGFNPQVIQPETVTEVAKASKKLGIALFAAAAAGIGYVATRPRVQRAIKELMTPEPANATVEVAAKE